MIKLELEISKHSNDIVMKAAAEMFKNRTLEILGLKTARIVDIMPTVLPVVEAREKRLDFVFLLEDDSLLHLEFQTTIPEDLLYRIAYYGARIVERHKREVTTAVIYSGRISTAPELLQKGSLTYQVQNIFLKNMDADAEYSQIKAAIEQGKASDEELFKLIFLPLMKSDRGEAEMSLQAAELAKSSQSPHSSFVIGAIVAISDKFLPEDYKKKLLEVLRMTQIEQWLREEGREEGMKEGIREGMKEGKLEAARNALKEGLDPSLVVKITNLPLETIHKLKKELSN